MKATTLNIWLFALALTAVGIVVFIVMLKSEIDSNLIYLNRLTLIGTIAGFIGLIITLFQFLTLSQIAKETKDELEATKEGIKKFFTITEIAKSIKVIHEISTSLIGKEYKASELRMQDLKPVLIQIKNFDGFDETQKQDFAIAFQDFNIDLSNIHSHLVDNSIQIDNSKVISHLEKISLVLIELEQTLKLKT